VKTIIAGDRTFSNYQTLIVAVNQSNFIITEVVSGAAKGVDTLGEKWAKEKSIPIKRFPADWSRYGKLAGPIRNKEMANYAEALIALPSKDSKGTRDMIRQAKSVGLKVFVYEI
jgi:predicted double-glycine peptidase